MQFAPQSPFVGRDREVRQLAEFVLQRRDRILAIQGAPGAGKTYLVRTFLHNNHVQAFWLNLAMETSTASPGSYLSPIIHAPEIREATVAAFQQAQLVVIDELRPEHMREILALVDDCPSQQFVLLTTDPLELPTTAIRMTIEPLGRQQTRELVEQWAIALGLSWTPQQMSDFLERFAGGHVIPRRLLLALDAMRRAGGFAPGLDALSPFTQSGLVDPEGRPLSSESSEFREVVARVEIVNTRLLDDVRHDPSLLYTLDPREFELLVAELLSQQGFAVDLTRQSRDGGVDMWLAENRSIGSFRYLVECKRYVPPSKVGVKIVREVFGTLQASRATAGLVVTTSYFTREAQAFAEQVRYQMSLRDYVNIREWLAVV